MRGLRRAIARIPTCTTRIMGSKVKGTTHIVCLDDGPCLTWSAVGAGTERGALEVLRSLFRITFLCWERANQDLHQDWILFRGRTLNPVHVEVVDDHVDNRYPSDHFPIYVQFLLPRTVRTIS